MNPKTNRWTLYQLYMKSWPNIPPAISYLKSPPLLPSCLDTLAIKLYKYIYITHFFSIPENNQSSLTIQMLSKQGAVELTEESIKSATFPQEQKTTADSESSEDLCIICLQSANLIRICSWQAGIYHEKCAQQFFMYKQIK